MEISCFNDYVWKKTCRTEIPLVCMFSKFLLELEIDDSIQRPGLFWGSCRVTTYVYVHVSYIYPYARAIPYLLYIVLSTQPHYSICIYSRAHIYYRYLSLYSICICTYIYIAHHTYLPTYLPSNIHTYIHMYTHAHRESHRHMCTYV